jgi:TPR repeat protein
MGVIGRIAGWLFGVLLMSAGLVLLALAIPAFKAWGMVPLLTGIGLMLLAAALIPPLRARIARLGPTVPLLTLLAGLSLTGAMAAITIALGVGGNRRIAAGEKPAPGVAALIRPAANLGVGEAAQHLGLVYLNGQDGPANPVLARYWTARAAAAGVTGAELDLARMYATGIGGPVDAAQALAWANKAEAEGLSDAYLFIGNLYARGGALPPDPVKATAAYTQGDAHGDAMATFNLALANEEGSGTMKNPERAVELYRKAADQGIAEAKLNLGVALMNGTGVARNDAEARKWLEDARTNANPEIRKLIDDDLAILTAADRSS